MACSSTILRPATWQLYRPARLSGGETLSIDFGKEQELGRKFALWVLMDAIGIAPLPADAFPKHPELKRAANNWLAASERLRDG
jgi:hypothetical protein